MFELKGLVFELLFGQFDGFMTQSLNGLLGDLRRYVQFLIYRSVILLV